jgi:hypothetical protein
VLVQLPTALFLEHLNVRSLASSTGWMQNPTQKPRDSYTVATAVEQRLNYNQTIVKTRLEVLVVEGGEGGKALFHHHRQ